MRFWICVSTKPLIGVIALRTEGDAEAVLAVDKFLDDNKDDGLVREVTLLIKRVLKRLDMTAKSLFSLVEPGSCFAGSLLEIALASDRVYMKDEDGVSLWVSPLNAGVFPMGNGLSRLESRFLADPSKASRVLEQTTAIDPQSAVKLGLVTFAPDDIDWDDEIRIAFEERAELFARRNDRHGTITPLRRPGDDGNENFRTAHRLAELDFPATERGR